MSSCWTFHLRSAAIAEAVWWICQCTLCCTSAVATSHQSCTISFDLSLQVELGLEDPFGVDDSGTLWSLNQCQVLLRFRFSSFTAVCQLLALGDDRASQTILGSSWISFHRTELHFILRLLFSAWRSDNLGFLQCIRVTVSLGHHLGHEETTAGLRVVASSGRALGAHLEHLTVISAKHRFLLFGTCLFTPLCTAQKKQSSSNFFNLRSQKLTTCIP